MNKRCLIIGGGGFIGYNLTEYLLKDDFHIKVIDRYTDNLNNIESTFSKLTLIKGEVAETKFLLDHLKDFENIIWLVHTTVPSTSMDNIEEDLTENIFPLIRFLSAIKTNPGIEKFIYLSSGGTIYGNPVVKKPITEDQPKIPLSSYGLTKYIAEHYINFILSESTIQRIIFRPSNVYGLYQNLNKPQGIIGHSFKAAINNHPLVLYNLGVMTRDFLFVTDLTNAIHKSLTTDKLKDYSYIFNIGSGKGFLIKEIINKITEISKLEIKIIDKPLRTFDCDYNVLSISKLTDHLNWAPKVSLEEGLFKVWNWIKAQN